MMPSFWRKKRRMTQADLAKSAGIAQGSEIESGQKPGTPTTLKLRQDRRSHVVRRIALKWIAPSPHAPRLRHTSSS
jgi:transcriptional regulator with XRE-family HTH domain